MSAELGQENFFDFDGDYTDVAWFNLDVFNSFPQDLPVAPKTSPFHQSDSGMSEMSEDVDFENPSSVESVCSSEHSTKMLDELVESAVFSPFCESGGNQEVISYRSGRKTRRQTMCENFDDIDSELTDYITSSNSGKDPEDLENLKAMVGGIQEKENKIINYKSKKSSVKAINLPVKKVHDALPKISLKESKKTSSQEEVTLMEEASTGVKSVKVLKVVKTSPCATPSETAAQVACALDDRNRKNAINAKLNREKKKAYIEGLENEIEKLRNENQKMKLENDQLQADKVSLQENVRYFKNVLANQSTLSKVLNTMENLKDVKLSSSLTRSSRKRGMVSTDHTYDSKCRKTTSDTSVAPARRFGEESSPAGVCLHVRDDTVSLEFCSNCAEMACDSS